MQTSMAHGDLALSLVFQDMLDLWRRASGDDALPTLIPPQCGFAYKARKEEEGGKKKLRPFQIRFNHKIQTMWTCTLEECLGDALAVCTHYPGSVPHEGGILPVLDYVNLVGKSRHVEYLANRMTFKATMWVEGVGELIGLPRTQECEAVADKMQLLVMERSASTPEALQGRARLWKEVVNSQRRRCHVFGHLPPSGKLVFLFRETHPNFSDTLERLARDHDVFYMDAHAATTSCLEAVRMRIETLAENAKIVLVLPTCFFNDLLDAETEGFANWVRELLSGGASLFTVPAVNRWKDRTETIISKGVRTTYHYLQEDLARLFAIGGVRYASGLTSGTSKKRGPHASQTKPSKRRESGF
jgi:hypothetical protein